MCVENEKIAKSSHFIGFNSRCIFEMISSSVTWSCLSRFCAPILLILSLWLRYWPLLSAHLAGVAFMQENPHLKELRAKSTAQFQVNAACESGMPAWEGRARIGVGMHDCKGLNRLHHVCDAARNQNFKVYVAWTRKYTRNTCPRCFIFCFHRRNLDAET